MNREEQLKGFIREYNRLIKSIKHDETDLEYLDYLKSINKEGNILEKSRRYWIGERIKLGFYIRKQIENEISELRTEKDNNLSKSLMKTIDEFDKAHNDLCQYYNFYTNKEAEKVKEA